MLKHLDNRYDFYFEKDVVANNVPIDAGHRHDWENVVVFLEGDQIKMVAPSCHGVEPYKGRTETPRLHEGTYSFPLLRWTRLLILDSP